MRRKIKNLQDSGFLIKDKKNKGYYWNLSQKEKKAYFDIIHTETKNLSSFIVKIILALNVFPNKESYDLVNKEIESQFSFYWYHYLSCQLEWLKWWQLRFKDNDLLLIALQATIPTLHFIDKKMNNVNVDDVFKLTGQVTQNECENCSVSATSVSEVTGIPRATAIRKLDKLVSLGFLVREVKSKRYSINQSTDARTKNIMSRDNVSFTIKTFSDYIAIIINSLVYNRL